MMRPRPSLPRITQNAIRLCRNRSFQSYLGADNEQEAKAELCRRCGVTSRKHLVWQPAGVAFSAEMAAFSRFLKEG